MLLTIDKRGSINLPSTIRKELGLETGSYLEMEVSKGGSISLIPVSIYPSLRLNERGLAKLKAARKSGTGKIPNWLTKEIKNVRNNTKQKIS
jgi:AbrB family looped-hinge helix DNA binding protein